MLSLVELAGVRDNPDAVVGLQLRATDGQHSLVGLAALPVLPDHVHVVGQVENLARERDRVELVRGDVHKLGEYAWRVGGQLGLDARPTRAHAVKAVSGPCVVRCVDLLRLDSIAVIFTKKKCN